jgi:hypothetical protein
MLRKRFKYHTLRMVMVRYLTGVVRAVHGCEVYVVIFRSSAGQTELLCLLTDTFSTWLCYQTDLLRS